MLSGRWQPPARPPLMLGALGRDGVGNRLGGGDPSARSYRAAVCERRRRGAGGVRALLALGLTYSSQGSRRGRPAAVVSGPRTGGQRCAHGLRRRSESTSSWPPALALRADLSLYHHGNPHWRQTI